MSESTGPFVVWLEECGASDAPEVGGKCANLGELLHAEIAVPPGFAVTTRAHREFLAANALAEREALLLESIDFDHMESLVAVSDEIRRLTESATIPEPIERAVRDAYTELTTRAGADAVPVAVRSSATAEDLATASFAGQLRTYLWMLGADAVLRQLRCCWAGFYTPEALSYRHKVGLEREQALMGVAVQQMVDARTAGVMFTLNPLNGDRSKIAIEASWGLGEALVSGEVNPDRFLLDKVTLDILERAVGHKEVEHRFDRKAGRVAAAPVEAERQDAPSVSDDELRELARQGKRIERHYGQPMDVEWAIDAPSGRLRMLQSRPETVWSQRATKPVGETGASALDYVIAEFGGSRGGSQRGGP